MCRLIWGFAGCTYHIVGNLMHWLIYISEKDGSFEHLTYVLALWSFFDIPNLYFGTLDGSFVHLTYVLACDLSLITQHALTWDVFVWLFRVPNMLHKMVLWLANVCFDRGRSLEYPTNGVVRLNKNKCVSQATFLKNRWGRQVFIFYFLFP